MEILTGALVTAHSKYGSTSMKIYGTLYPGPARDPNDPLTLNVVGNPTIASLAVGEAGIILCFERCHDYAYDSSMHDEAPEALVLTSQGVGWFLLEHLRKI